jgi:hypothetical protein
MTPRASDYAPVDNVFHWLAVVFSGMWVVGAYIDMYAHVRLTDELDTFFTPWHAPVFFGFGCTGALLLVTAFRNHQRGYPWSRSLPRAYFLSLLGIVGFWLAGAIDAAWHTMFGFEKDFDAVISPPHILLQFSATMTGVGPLRTIWGQADNPLRIPRGAIVFLSTYALLVFNNIFDYVNPFVFPWGMKSFVAGHPIGADIAQRLGFASMLLFVVGAMWIVLMSIRYWRPPFGTFCLILSAAIAAVACAYGRGFPFILDGAIAGLVADILYRSFLPGRNPTLRLRLFGFIVPVTLYGAYAVTILVLDETTWSIHMWGGVTVISGLIGVLLTFLVTPAPTDEPLPSLSARRS